MEHNGKTIRQIADELGVSKQAIRKRVNQLPPTCVSVGTNHAMLINPYGISIIASLVSTKISSVDTNQVPTGVNQSANQTPTGINQSTNQALEVDPFTEPLVNILMAELRLQLATKDKQLDMSATQIEALNARLAEMSAQMSDLTAALVTAQQTAQAAQALHAGTLQAQLGDGGGSVGGRASGKPGLFARLFGGAKRSAPGNIEVD